MKTVAALLLAIALMTPIGFSSPASPIWVGSPGITGENINFLWRSPFDANWGFQQNQLKYLAVASFQHKGTRFNIGSSVDRSVVFGDEDKMIFAGVDKRISEYWWIALGYQGGRDQNKIMNIDAAYYLGLNAVVTFGYSFYNNYEMKNAIRTRLVINF